jgi:Flp pilus assembly protein CpaB
VRRRTIAITAAVVLALAAAGLVVWYVSSLRDEEKVAEPTQTVLVAVSDIAARTSGEDVVANNLVERQEVVVSSVAPGALINESQLQGQVLTVPVAKGQQILQSQLGVPEEQSLSYRIANGMRAISIAVDRKNAVGGAIKEGDRVDVIATFDADQFDQLQPTTSSTLPSTSSTASPTTASPTVRPTTAMNLGLALSLPEVARIKALTGLDLAETVSDVSVTILQQVEVLDMDILQPVTSQSSGGGGVLSAGDKTTTEEVPDTPVITLMVSPADAEKITYAQTYGKITFTLVPAQDTTKVEVTGHALPNMFR